MTKLRNKLWRVRISLYCDSEPERTIAEYVLHPGDVILPLSYDANKYVLRFLSSDFVGYIWNMPRRHLLRGNKSSEWFERIDP